MNHRGDTIATYDISGSLIVEMWYDAFGNVVQTYPSANLPFYTFSTKEYLADVALYLYQYRVYDPIAGRWTQRDPIDYKDSENLYQFCGNDSVNNIDSYGCLADIVVDIGFVIYDCVSWSINYFQDDKLGMAVDSLALGADGACIFIPFATGGGMAVRLAGAGTKAVSTGVAVARTAQVAAKVTQAAYMTGELGGKIIEDMDNNPDDWEATSESSEPATGKKYKGGTSHEKTMKNKKTGEEYQRHTIKNKNGNVVHDHIRESN